MDGVDSKVDHHDSVFKDDSNEENEADKGVDGEALIEEVESKEASE